MSFNPQICILQGVSAQALGAPWENRSGIASSLGIGGCKAWSFLKYISFSGVIWRARFNAPLNLINLNYAEN